MAINNENMHKS